MAAQIQNKTFKTLPGPALGSHHPTVVDNRQFHQPSQTHPSAAGSTKENALVLGDDSDSDTDQMEDIDPVPSETSHAVSLARKEKDLKEQIAEVRAKNEAMLARKAREAEMKNKREGVEPGGLKKRENARAEADRIAEREQSVQLLQATLDEVNIEAERLGSNDESTHEPHAPDDSPSFEQPRLDHDNGSDGARSKNSLKEALIPEISRVPQEHADVDLPVRPLSVQGSATSTGQKWTPEEDMKLLKAKGKGMSSREISEQILSHRSMGAIDSRLHLLTKTAEGSETSSQGRWTSEEDSKLLEARENGMSCREIFDQILPHRSVSAIENRLASLRMAVAGSETSSRGAWTAVEDSKLLKAKEDGMSNPEIVQQILPHRSIKGIEQRLFKLKAIADGKHQAPLAATLWTVQEDTKLVEAKNDKLSFNVIADRILPTRSADACRNRYVRLTQGNGYSTAWTPQEESKLRRAKDKDDMSFQEISDEILPHRTPDACEEQYYKMKNQLTQEEKAPIRIPIKTATRTVKKDTPQDDVRNPPGQVNVVQQTLTKSQEQDADATTGAEQTPAPDRPARFRQNTSTSVEPLEITFDAVDMTQISGKKYKGTAKPAKTIYVERDYNPFQRQPKKGGPKQGRKRTPRNAREKEDQDEDPFGVGTMPTKQEVIPSSLNVCQLANL